ncbi:hypothetical protein P4O66_011255, partial [Electrophorus voltai]
MAGQGTRRTCGQFLIILAVLFRYTDAIRREGLFREQISKLKSFQIVTPQLVRDRKRRHDDVKQATNQASCHYNGHVEGREDSLVALSTCNGLRYEFYAIEVDEEDLDSDVFMGVIFLGNESYGLEPAVNSSTNEHLLFPLKHVQTEPFVCGLANDISHSNDGSHEAGLSMIKFLRRKRNLPQTRYVELVLVVDNQRFIFKKRNVTAVKNEMVQLTNLVDTYYQQLNIRIILVGLEIFEAQNPFSVSGSAGAVLGNFVDWRKTNLVPRIQNDMAQLIVGQAGAYSGGILGMAFVGSVCSVSTAGGISVYSDNQLQYYSTVLAHEMGHNLGMYHDDTRCQCGTNGYCIMDSTATTLRLYAKWKEGDRGLVSVRATIQDEPTKIQECTRIIAPSDKFLVSTSDSRNPRRMETRRNRDHHGMHQIVGVADMEKSYKWLEKARLTDSNEALIMAAQEQVLNTRSVEAGIYTKQYPGCRLGKDALETIQHITVGCKMLAGREYMEGHNEVAGIVYRNTCATYRLDIPPKVVENDHHNVRNKEHEKLEKYQELKEEPQKKVKETVLPVAIRALGAVICKLGELHHPGTSFLNGRPGSTLFSECSGNDFATLISRGGGVCLKNQPLNGSFISVAECGNGILDPEEQCDCGLPGNCTNPCCDAATCTFTRGSTCAAGSCCKNCQLLVSGTLCRSSVNECDLPEFCLGSSGFCPRDTYLMDGIQCAANTAYCYEGRCQTLDYQCKQLFGSTATKADNQCFRYINMQGTMFGNCGYSGSTLVPCSSANIMCGKIQCTNFDSNYPPAGAVISVQNIGQNISCRNANFNLGPDVMDPTYVQTGTVCDTGKVCIKFQCVNSSKLTQTGTCNAGSDCHGNGVCNNLGHCFCNDGWGPPNCNVPGRGGSVDSGPAEIDYSLRNGLLIFFLLVVPLLAGLVLLLLFVFRRDMLRRCLNCHGDNTHGSNSMPQRSSQPSSNVQSASALPATVRTPPTRPQVNSSRNTSAKGIFGPHVYTVSQWHRSPCAPRWLMPKQMPMWCRMRSAPSCLHSGRQKLCRVKSVISARVGLWPGWGVCSSVSSPASPHNSLLPLEAMQ